MNEDRKTIILYPVITEDAIAMIEAENKLVFIVHRKATRPHVKAAVKELYGVDVEKVNILVTPHGQKKAFVKLKPKFKAADVAIKLGIL